MVFSLKDIPKQNYITEVTGHYMAPVCIIMLYDASKLDVIGAPRSHIVINTMQGSADDSDGDRICRNSPRQLCPLYWFVNNKPPYYEFSRIPHRLLVMMYVASFAISRVINLVPVSKLSHRKSSEDGDPSMEK